MKVSSLVRIGTSAGKLFTELMVLRLELGWRVRATRRAFEKELTKQGMSKDDARRLSLQYSRLKDSVMSAASLPRTISEVIK